MRTVDYGRCGHINLSRMNCLFSFCPTCLWSFGHGTVNLTLPLVLSPPRTLVLSFPHHFLSSFNSLILPSSHPLILSSSHALLLSVAIEGTSTRTTSRSPRCPPPLPPGIIRSKILAQRSVRVQSGTDHNPKPTCPVSSHLVVRCPCPSDTDYGLQPAHAVLQAVSIVRFYLLYFPLKIE